ncbi:hypothetical protein QF034_008092 [Streptomyces africanus]|uniref:Uncharacterized protein n=1 Tax=Streptomyces africanus TaxID=231024 RepID=A0ABU0R2H5_9ACTN|nr:DUF6228 family protein [Streptomyces africanus]MDQ0753861.1 hypothetical protein [Streptomyces africanus]
MVEEGEASPAVRVGGESPQAIKLCFHGLSRSFPEERDDPMRDFIVTAHSEAVRIEVSVRTWSGDGLDVFLAELAEEFRGWNGPRTWRSLERDLTLSAEHVGSRVRLTWGLHDRFPDDDWRFEATTDHSPGEDMRNLAIEMRSFLESAPLE